MKCGRELGRSEDTTFLKSLPSRGLVEFQTWFASVLSGAEVWPTMAPQSPSALGILVASASPEERDRIGETAAVMLALWACAHASESLPQLFAASPSFPIELQRPLWIALSMAVPRHLQVVAQHSIDTIERRALRALAEGVSESLALSPLLVLLIGPLRSLVLPPLLPRLITAPFPPLFASLLKQHERVPVELAMAVEAALASDLPLLLDLVGATLSCSTWTEPCPPLTRLIQLLRDSVDMAWVRGTPCPPVSAALSEACSRLPGPLQEELHRLAVIEVLAAPDRLPSIAALDPTGRVLTAAVRAHGVASLRPLLRETKWSGPLNSRTLPLLRPLLGQCALLKIALAQVLRAEEGSEGLAAALGHVAVVLGLPEDGEADGSPLLSLHWQVQSLATTWQFLLDRPVPASPSTLHILAQHLARLAHSAPALHAATLTIWFEAALAERPPSISHEVPPAHRLRPPERRPWAPVTELPPAPLPGTSRAPLRALVLDALLRQLVRRREDVTLLADQLQTTLAHGYALVTAEQYAEHLPRKGAWARDLALEKLLAAHPALWSALVLCAEQPRALWRLQEQLIGLGALLLGDWHAEAQAQAQRPAPIQRAHLERATVRFLGLLGRARLLPALVRDMVGVVSRLDAGDVVTLIHALVWPALVALRETEVPQELPEGAEAPPEPRDDLPPGPAERRQLIRLILVRNLPRTGEDLLRLFPT